MWYVFYCQNVNKQELMQYCKQYFSKEILKDVFILTYDRMRKYEGAWHLEQYPIFPDCIFFEIENENLDNLEKRVRELETLNQLSKLNQCQEAVPVFEKYNSIQSVCREEEAFFKKMCNSQHNFEMSRGYIKDGKTYVTEGSLQGYEKWIRKIDRHKRLAKLELPYESERKEIQVGLEIFEKR